MGVFLDANDLAARAPGTNPKWTEATTLNTSTDPPTFTEATGAPSSVLDGQDNGDPKTIALLVELATRVVAKPHATAAAPADAAEVNHRSCRLTISGFVASAEYTAELDGTSVTTTSQPYADVEAALQEIKAEIEGDVTLDALVTVTEVDAVGGGSTDTLLIKGKAEADYIIDTISASAGTLACIADAASASVRVWLKTGGVETTANPRPPAWALANGADFTTDEYRGVAERLDVAGFSRAYAEVYDVTAVTGDDSSITQAYRAWLGVCVLPGE